MKKITATKLNEFVKEQLENKELSKADRADFLLYSDLESRKSELNAYENRKLRSLSALLEERYADSSTEPVTGVVHVTTSDLCAIFGRTRKSIAEWVRMGLPKLSKGLYNMKDVLDWWLSTIHRASSATVEISEWKRRLIIAKARQEEIKLAELEGKLVHRQDAEMTITTACTDLRNTLLNMPSRLYPNDDKHRMALKAELVDTLESFCRNAAFIDDRAPLKEKKPVQKPKKPVQKPKKTVRKKSK